jgi:hypothetical protein
MRRSISVVALAALISPFLEVYATEEVISYSQESIGSATVTLRGLIPYCYYPLGGFYGSPTFAISSTAIVVDSSILIGECAGPVNPPPEPAPYELSITVPVINDGVYLVDWVFLDNVTLGPVHMPPQDHYSSLVVKEGQVPVFSDGFDLP